MLNTPVQIVWILYTNLLVTNRSRLKHVPLEHEHLLSEESFWIHRAQLLSISIPNAFVEQRAMTLLHYDASAACLPEINTHKQK